MADQQERMTNTMDNWIVKYSQQHLGVKLSFEDKKKIGYDNINATQNPGSELWMLEVTGSIAGGGPSFEGKFTMKLDTRDNEWMIRKDEFRRTN